MKALCSYYHKLTCKMLLKQYGVGKLSEIRLHKVLPVWGHKRNLQYNESAVLLSVPIHSAVLKIFSTFLYGRLIFSFSQKATAGAHEVSTNCVEFHAGWYLFVHTQPLLLVPMETPTVPSIFGGRSLVPWQWIARTVEFGGMTKSCAIAGVDVLSFSFTPST